MSSEDFGAVVRRALLALGAADQVTLVETATTTDTGAMTAELRLGAGDAAKTVAIAVAPTADAAQVDAETRAELRRALRMCPLCQRIGHVEKLRGAHGQQEGCIVRCPACGEFEIDQELIRRFRSAWEHNDASVLQRLPWLSERTRAGSHIRITSDNWRDSADDQTGTRR